VDFVGNFLILSIAEHLHPAVKRDLKL